MRKRTTISVGSLRVEVYPWTHPTGRDYWRFDYRDAETGERKQATGASIEKLRPKIERVIGKHDPLKNMPASIRGRLARLLEADPTLRLLDEFLDWKERKQPSVTLHAAIDEFLAAKEANRGGSERNVRSLRGDLGNLRSHFTANKQLAAITVKDLEGWLKQFADLSAHRRKNLRGSAVTLFRWCKRRKYLPHELTAAEALERPQIVRKIPPTYTASEMGRMLDACPAQYLPWLVLSAFHGLRYSELFPPYGSGKSPLDWSDIDLDRGLIIVRPETAKTNERRVIPLHASAAAWLDAGKGRVCPKRPPNKVLKDSGSVTGALGALVGGWKPNGLRNSFISYRAPLVGLAQTAMEAGTSEAEARRSYNDAKSKADGEAWFSLLDCRTV